VFNYFQFFLLRTTSRHLGVDLVNLLSKFKKEQKHAPANYREDKGAYKEIKARLFSGAFSCDHHTDEHEEGLNKAFSTERDSFIIPLEG